MMPAQSQTVATGDDADLRWQLELYERQIDDSVYQWRHVKHDDLLSDDERQRGDALSVMAEETLSTCCW